MLRLFFFFFFKQKTAYEITYGDWSSDVCSSDLCAPQIAKELVERGHGLPVPELGVDLAADGLHEPEERHSRTSEQVGILDEQAGDGRAQERFDHGRPAAGQQRAVEVEQAEHQDE